MCFQWAYTTLIRLYESYICINYYYFCISTNYLIRCKIPRSACSYLIRRNIPCYACQVFD
ncbi:hypothetical protein HanIR_Chr10g0485471 [Helianthus annuus]|nr:hypothetical protein HanIR_Chr10g0485471 [Helianthus annuus]